MTFNIINIDNFRIELNLLTTQINIKLIDIKSNNTYDTIINKNNINVKSIDKFYLIIVNSLNKELDHNFTINETDTKINLIISYNTEIVDIDQNIIFVKSNNSNTKETYLINIIIELIVVLYCLTVFLINELFLMVCTLTKLLILLLNEFNNRKTKKQEPILNKQNELLSTVDPIYDEEYVFGISTFNDQIIKFNINCVELDFRPYIIFTENQNYYKKCDSLSKFNNFKNVKKIITYPTSIEYIIEPNLYEYFTIYRSGYMLPMLSVTELIIDCKFNNNQIDSEYNSLTLECPSTKNHMYSTISFDRINEYFPNLKKLSFINICINNFNKQSFDSNFESLIDYDLKNKKSNYMKYLKFIKITFLEGHDDFEFLQTITKLNDIELVIDKNSKS